LKRNFVKTPFSNPILPNNSLLTPPQVETHPNKGPKQVPTLQKCPNHPFPETFNRGGKKKKEIFPREVNVS